MAKKRGSRQEAIKELVRNSAMRTQRDLVKALMQQGFACTQATVSRDITEMGLKKLPEGIYVLGEDLHLQRMFSSFVEHATSAKNLIVVKGQPGCGQAVAAAIDAAELSHVIGSVSGDDTVLVVSDTDKHALEIAEYFDRLKSN